MRDLRDAIATLMHQLAEIQREDDSDPPPKEWEIWRGVNWFRSFKSTCYFTGGDRRCDVGVEAGQV